MIREENKLKWPSILKFGSKNDTAGEIAAYDDKIDPELKYQLQHVKFKTLRLRPLEQKQPESRSSLLIRQ